MIKREQISTVEDLPPPTEAIEFVVGDPDAAHTTYSEHGPLTKTDGAEGQLLAVDPQPMGTLQIATGPGVRYTVPVVGRISYKQADSLDGQPSEVAIVDMRRFTPAMEGYRSAKLGMYTYQPKSAEDPQSLRVSPFALVDLRALRDDEINLQGPRQLAPIAGDPQHPTILSMFKSGRGDKFSTGYNKAGLSEVGITVDDNDRIVVQGGVYASGKFSLTTANTVKMGYQPSYSQVETARNGDREKAARLAAIQRGAGRLLVNHAIPNRPLVNHQIPNLPISVGGGVFGDGDSILGGLFEDFGILADPKPEVSPPPRPDYELKIDAEITTLVGDGLSPNKIRRKLARAYSPDTVADNPTERKKLEDAMSYANSQVDAIADR